jgi:hypothetical protein
MRSVCLPWVERRNTRKLQGDLINEGEQCDYDDHGLRHNIPQGRTIRRAGSMMGEGERFVKKVTRNEK